MTFPLLLAQAASTELPPELLTQSPLLLFGFSVFFILVIAGALIDLQVLLRTKGRLPEWAVRNEWITQRPWDRFDVGIIFLGLMTLMAFAMLLIQIFIGSDKEALQEHEALLFFVQSLILSGAPIVIVNWLLRRKKITWARAFGFRRDGLRKNLALAGMFYLSVLPVVVLFSMVFHVLMDKIGREVEMQNVVEMLAGTDSPWLLGYLIVLAVCVAPFIEEVLFRGIALPLLSRKFGVLPGIVLVSITFGLLHGQLHAFIPLSFLSFVLCMAYLKTRTLLVPICIHFLFNSVNVCLLMASKSPQ